MSGPTFAVIGAARSGTTAITESLRRHPDAFVTSPKEPHYFAFAGHRPAFTGPGDEEGINRKAVTDPDDYLALYRGAEHLLARGEGSVSTFYYFEPAILAIKAMNPQMRLVVVLRDPVDRAFSSFQYLRMHGREPEEEFEAAVAAEESRRAAGWHHLWHYSAMSRYADSIAAFLDAFGDEPLCVLTYEQITNDPSDALGQVYEHLGLDASLAGTAGARRVNSSGRPRSARAQAVLNRLGHQPRVKTVGKRLVPFSVRERVRRWNQADTSVPTDVRARLAPVFAADLDRVEDLLGRRLPPWGRPPPP
jgi:hypothetical protein